MPDTGWRHYEPLELSPILTSALDAFYEQGFHGTAVRDIARRVGVTVPALYYYHENKEAILVALLETATKDVASRAFAAAEEGGGDPAAEFANVVEAVVLHMTHRVRLAALDSELRYLQPANRKHYAQTRKQLEDLLTGIIADGVRGGVFAVTEPAETSRALLGMCQAVATWYHDGGPLGPEELAARYVEIALRTVGANGGQTSSDRQLLRLPRRPVHRDRRGDGR
ncbi:TetR/AcrR family transcriptional regulator [Amycolatopsis acidiphila]|uniref:TetR/AcrR family transcriptional regulator n=1 Tax=Amycolatopsis acidiphila TaxID=715473 RepID=A0A557ZSV2_9PSEU|nr:TetR/AcrR family transcriptional regulator [Amycolatopsis acidiphila]TVT15062.1 TetR/AcrR family transcriptional regulator [Amycolatopsis acidiphila]UIJ56837.1 TetR/AcrR family transcriptional regulator [Amycolatopsis acidiphila]GHG54853.1 TetR family transcriptional regulator [Amycolatopsis acidiphila]